MGASEKTRVVEIPAPLRDGRYLRFYLMQTKDIAMAKELKGVYSTGQQWVNTGLIPTARWTVDFRFGEVSYVNSTAFFGQTWTGNRYLLNQQSNSFYFHSGGTKFNITPTGGTDYRYVMDDDSRGYLTYNGQTSTITGLARTVEASQRFAIFGCSSGDHLATFRFNRMKIVDRCVALRDYIPAMNAQGVAGLYDQLHDTFYASQTTTPLVAGEE